MGHELDLDPDYACYLEWEFVHEIMDSSLLQSIRLGLWLLGDNLT